MLTERQKMILSAIVNDYITSAEPIGSRSISKRAHIGFSPATIRNEMADLEEMGFLEQPHTSAGRIPSHKGYRYFVDYLVTAEDLGSNELKVLKLFFAEKIYKTEESMRQVAAILSNMTKYTAFALGPEMLDTTLRHVQLVPLNQETAVAIIVTSTGHVENKTISIPKDIEMHEMERFINLLNDKLTGVSLLNLRSRLYTEISKELSKHVEKYKGLIDMLEEVLHSKSEDRIYLSGMTNMLNQPEFKDVDKVKSIFDLFDETDTLLQLFSNSKSGIQVKIGTENLIDAIHQCSLITANYSLDGKSLGSIGILGPTRMDYGKVINLLDYLSKDMTLMYSKWYK